MALSHQPYEAGGLQQNDINVKAKNTVQDAMLAVAHENRFNPLDAYLRDHTGNRRFWLAKCGQTNLDALRQDRDQLWAEAVVAFHKGEEWWLEGSEIALAGEEQANRFEYDV